jgi:DNA polymerase III epsilon subunit-like protein
MHAYVSQAIALVQSGRPLLLFDTETTGTFDPGQEPPDVWELAAIFRPPRGQGEKREARRIINIGRPIPEEANLRHLPADTPMTRGKPAAEVLNGFAVWLSRNPILVGHNIDKFDCPVLAVAYQRAGLPVPEIILSQADHIDTLTLAYKLLPYRGQPGGPPEGFGLLKLAKFLGVPVPSEGNLHGALADTRLTEGVLFALMRRALAANRVLRPPEPRP